MKQKLAVIGGSYLQLPLVEKAKSMGIETHCFAWEQEAICKDIADYFYPISITEKELILNKCRKIGIDGICSIASDLAVLTVNYVVSRMHLVGNDDRHSKIQTDKYLMREQFHLHNCPSPQFFLIENNDCSDISQQITSKKIHFPLIVKPTDRSGSRGIEKVNDIGQLYRAVERANRESFAKRVIVEEYIEGKEISVESISWKGRHYILQFTDKVTTNEPYFVELEHHQPSALSDDLKSKISSLVTLALDSLHIANGASHSELRIAPDGKIYFMEIGARMGGDFIGSDLVQLSTGYDFLRGVIEVALGTFNEPQLNEQHHSGVYFLSEATATLQPIIERNTLPQIIRAEITDTTLRPLTCSGDRSGYLIYQSDKKLSL